MEKTIKELRIISNEKYSSHPGYSWILAGFFIFFSCGLSFLLYHFLGSTILCLCLSIFPILFSVTISHRLLTIKKEPSIKKSFKYYFSFFSPRFIGSYRLWTTYFKSLLIYLPLTVLFAFANYYLFFAKSPTISNSLMDLLDILANGDESSIGIMSNILADNNFEVMKLLYSIVGSSFAITSFFFIWFAGKEALSVNIINETPELNQALIKYIFKQTLKENRGYINKMYLGLNWPAILLFILGFSGGFFIGILNPNMKILPMEIGLSCGLALFGIYLPFFLSNEEALIDSLKTTFSKMSIVVTKDLLNKVLIKNPKIDPAERAQIESIIAKMDKDLEEYLLNEPTRGTQDTWTSIRINTFIPRGDNTNDDKEKDPPNDESD